MYITSISQNIAVHYTIVYKLNLYQEVQCYETHRFILIERFSYQMLLQFLMALLMLCTTYYSITSQCGINNNHDASVAVITMCYFQYCPTLQVILAI